MRKKSSCFVPISIPTMYIVCVKLFLLLFSQTISKSSTAVDLIKSSWKIQSSQPSVWSWLKWAGVHPARVKFVCGCKLHELKLRVQSINKIWWQFYLGPSSSHGTVKFKKSSSKVELSKSQPLMTHLWLGTKAKKQIIFYLFINIWMKVFYCFRCERLLW